MPKLTVADVGEFEVPQGKRLVLALEDEATVDQLHACGGNARCTTCRVEFLAGESVQSHGLSGREVFHLAGLAALADDGPLPREVRVRADDKEFVVTVRIDTPFEREVFLHGGILPFTLRQLARP